MLLLMLTSLSKTTYKTHNNKSGIKKKGEQVSDKVRVKLGWIVGVCPIVNFLVLGLRGRGGVSLSDHNMYLHEF